MKAIVKAALAASLVLSAGVAKADSIQGSADQHQLFNTPNPACASVDARANNNGKSCRLSTRAVNLIVNTIKDAFSIYGNPACASIKAKNNGRPCHIPSYVTKRGLNAGD